MTVQRILDSQQTVEKAHIAPDAKVSDVLSSLAFRNVGALVVSTDGDTVEGVISERDIVRGLQKIGAGLLDKPVKEVMTEKVVTCVATDRAAGIMAVMVSKHLPRTAGIGERRHSASSGVR